MRARTRFAFPAVLVSLLALGCAGGGSQQQAAPSPMQAGARIWGNACNNCHNLRQGTEYGAREWPIIVNHMRTRAGLTRSEAEAVAVFLQTVAERASQGS